MSNYGNTKGRIFAIITLFLVLPAALFCQSGTGQLGGTVKSSIGGALPGSAVTATNSDTNSETKTLATDEGKYSFHNLQPGNYRLSVEAAGFDTCIVEDVKIEANELKTIDAVLKESTDTSMRVRVEEWAPIVVPLIHYEPLVILDTSKVLSKLPSTSNDAMDFINIIGGVTPAIDNLLHANTQMLGGTMAPDVNVLRDGINANKIRLNFGIQTTAHINPEIVLEIRTILSPADAEYGWGAGQVQINTRSGGNDYHGSVAYNVQNDALNARNWNQNNFSNNWNSQHNYTATLGGRIKKERTFFFANFDQTVGNNRSDVTPIVLTQCAKKGIFRYFSGWDNRNAASSMSTSAAIPYRAVVNSAGVPLAAGLVPDSQAILFQPDGKTVSSLQLQSVFGRLTSNAQALLAQDPVNCSKYDPYNNLSITNYWETSASSAGFRGLDTITVPRFSNMMPLPNNYSMMTSGYSNNGGDGLNTAVMKWVRKNAGAGAVYPGSAPNSRKSINMRLDQNFNERQRMSVNYMIEPAGTADANRLWPNAGFEGTDKRTPQQIGLVLKSEVASDSLNEVTFGFARMAFHSNSPMSAPENGGKAKDMLQHLVPTDNFSDYRNLPLIAGLGAERDPWDMTQTAQPTVVFSPEGSGPTYGNFGNPSSHPYGIKNNSLPATFSGADNRWTIADGFTWTKGMHWLRTSGDIRLTKSHLETNGTSGFSNNALTLPSAFGGFTAYSLPSWNYPTDAGLTGSPSYLLQAGGGILANSTGTAATMVDLLTYMSGSISNIRQQYFINNANDRKWNDAIGKNEMFHQADVRQKQFSFFAKDDWRIIPDLTLNLGMRYEYYGIPWAANGMTAGLQGGPSAMFGITGRDISSWMSANPANLGDAYLTREISIGPNSPNYHQSFYEKDFNNFGPAVGFSWQIPWFGRNKTIMRGGYQISYRAIGSASALGYSDSLPNVAGMTYTNYYRGESALPYISVANLADLVPTNKRMDPAIVPLDTMKIRNHGVSYTAYDYHVRNPYSQSLNLSFTHNITNYMILDVRYAGTLARKSIGGINLNTPNFINNGLISALNEARKGGNPGLFDKMFNRIQFENVGNIVAIGTLGSLTGADVIRRKWAAPLANGDYASIATSLANLNYSKEFASAAGTSAINASLPDIPAGEQGAVLRLANSKYPGLFPENYILTNPQLSTAELRGNLIHSNYHSMQAQILVRPVRGISLTSTYTFAKNLADRPGGFWASSGWTDPTNRTMDYKLSYVRKHQWNTYGFMDLPFGPNGFFFRNVRNANIMRVMEGWQFSWILAMQSGLPQQVTGGVNHLYNNGTLLDLAGPKTLAPGNDKLDWAPGSNTGYLYGSSNSAKYIVAADPQCSSTNLIGGSGYGYFGVQPLSSFCSMQALYLRNPDGSRGQVILQQPLPGHQGTFSSYIEGPGSVSLSVAMGKEFMLDGEKSINVRIDCTNALNHALPVNPLLALTQYAEFGSVSSKTGNRIVQGKIAFRF